MIEILDLFSYFVICSYSCSYTFSLSKCIFFSLGGGNCCITLFNCVFVFFFVPRKKWQQASTVLLPLLSPFLWQRSGTVDLERQSLHVVIRQAFSLNTLVAEPGPAQDNVWVNDRLIVTVLIYLGCH